jgi:BirA family biotin operon repressor/biotin-[acetyl-CoA-carboxylase] ligase
MNNIVSDSNNKTLQWAGRERYCYDTLDSTNTKAMELAGTGCSHGTLVIAESQEMGKGRRGRSWSSEKGSGIYMSMVLRPDLTPDKAPGLTLVAALSVIKAIEDVEKIQPDTLQIKWPNDIVLNKKKVCGILTELQLDGTKVGSVIVGIGVNVHQKHFPEEIKETATSLELETGENFHRRGLVEHILRCFEIYYDKYMQTGDLSLLRQEYESYLVSKEQVVKVLDPAGEYEGIAKGITPRGALIVETESGLCYIDSGEVSVRGIYGYV